MAFRMGALAIGGGIIVAAGLVAFFHPDRPPEPEATPRSESSPPPHPGAADSGSAGTISPGASPPPRPSPADDAPAIAWIVPKTWQSLPNPNGMRLATYRASPDPADGNDAEVSVSRAGGTTDANIQRWRGQFADTDQARRAQKTVHGLPVTLVEISGTYSAGPMMQGPSGAASHPGYALVAAIVETPGMSYFFKMVGPAQKVRAARSSFDALIDSVSPR